MDQDTAQKKQGGFRAFLERKGVRLSWRRYFIDAMGAMAFGLFASLLVGTILNTIGERAHWPFLTDEVWPSVLQAVGPAIAVAIAAKLEAPDLVLFATTVVGYEAYRLGGPVGVFLAVIVAVELGKLISKETKLDIILTPSVTIISGILVAKLVGPGVQALMQSIGNFIGFATQQQPFLMGILVSVVMGLALTFPISSAALAMMFELSGLAAGAATIGCSCQMIGFAVISYRDNGVGGLAAQGLGTSMLQMPNIIKNPWVLLPPTLASAIIAPLATLVFKLENTPYGAGMGTSGLVGQIGTLQVMSGRYGTLPLLGIVLLMHFVLPAIVSLLLAGLLRKRGRIHDGDLKLEV